MTRKRWELSLAFLAPRWHRAYVRDHPGWPWITLGIGISGLIGLITPWLVEESVIALILPEWSYYLFNAIWFLGGAASTFGNLRGRSDVEVGGLALVAGGLAAYYIAVISVRATSSLTALFIAFLTVGAVSRASHLFSSGGYAGEKCPKEAAK